MDESSSVTSTTSSTSVTLTADTSPGGGGSSSSSPMVSVRIYVPELNVQKVIHFHREELVWNVKQQCLATLPKELKESFNYGLFYPPSNGRAGKFLDEERPLSDYPFNGPGGYLELKYKRRVYKMLHLDEKQLRSLHTRVNLRRFFDYVTSAQTEKIAKMCAKGLDPNIHCQDTGETPLTIAAVSARPGPLLLALVGGGALIDYRTRCGSTALHRAAEKNNIEAVRTLLDLGASPNYRDAKNLTPLWNAVSSRASPMLCQALLHDYSIHGVQDAQGWHEVHQACRNGLVQHLENLLFYGAEMNAKNASGNTPLHVCAVDNQEACARLLLFRGADREALNFANQTPYQVAVIAGNLELAALIHRFRTEDVVPFKEVPSFNPRRRMSMASMRHSMSSSSVMHLMASAGDNASSIGSSSTTGSSGTPSPTLVYSRPLMLRRQAPSPSPSQSHWLDHSHLQLCNSSTVSVRSDTGSSCTAESEDGNGSSLTDKISVDQCDIVSDSSGVGTSNSGSGGSYDANRPHSEQQQSLVLPGMTVVCTDAYSSKEANHLSLQPGDIIEVTGSTDCGLLEGWLRGDSGFFPPHCVQEVRLRHPAAIAAARQHPSPASSVVIAHKPPPPPPPSSQPPVTPPSTMGITLPMAPQPLPLGKTIEARAAGRREMVTQNYGTTPRMKQVHGEPRTVILHKGQRGFGFVLRGAKMTSNKDMQPIQHRVPALQYLDSVEAGSVADRAGLRPGDFILAINGEDLAQASHEKVVDCIRRSGNLVQLTICSAISSNQQQPIRQPEYATIGNSSSNNTSRQYSTLPRKLSSNRPPQPPKRDPRTTLSVGRARARSMVVALNEMEMSQSSAEGGEEVYANGTASRTASIRSRSGSGRVSTTDLERLTIPTAVAPPAPPTSGQSSPRSPRVYASVAEMKRMRKLKGSTELLKLHKEFHSTPELCWEQENGEVMTSSWAPDPMEVMQMQSLAASEALPSGGNDSTEDWHKSHSQDDVYRGLQLKAQNERNSRRSWAMANNQKQAGRWAAGKSSKKKGTAVPSAANSSSRYHGSWHNIEASSTSHGDEEDDEETEGDIDDDDEDDEEAATPIAEQLTLLGNGEYRAVKTCRPVYATGLSNTLPRRAGSPHCAAPPPSHPPPPPPPPSQVIRVDVTKSHGEYAAAAAVLTVPTPGGGGAAASGDRPTTPVMSSFRPSDNAKLYALPQDQRNVGYSTLRPTKKPPASTLTTPSPPPSNITVTSRSKSLPPRPGRPSLVAVKSDETDNRPRVSVTVNSTPLIPDPDYGSEEDEDEEEEHRGSSARQGRRMEKGMPKSQSFCTDILKAKSLLKASISYPEELNDCQQQEQLQQQQSEESYVTFVPVNGEQQQRTGGNGRRAVTRHAVSLIQLPPPVENGENDSSSSDERTLQQMMVNGGNEQDSVSTISTLSSLSTSSNSSDRDATILETRNGRLMNEAERTIEESLQLIRKHVDELSGMNHRPGSNGKSARALLFPHQQQQQPDSDDEGGFLPPPPPEFSDVTGGQQQMMKLHQQQSSPSRQMLPKSMSSGHIRSCAIDRVIERRLSDEVIGSQSGNSNRPGTVRVVGAVPKKVSFSPEVIDAETQRGQYQQLQQQQLKGGHFASKPLLEWNLHDTADWLDSLFLNEYKATFVKRSVDGQALARINTETLLGLGVKKLGHRLNIEKSLKHYAAKN